MSYSCTIKTNKYIESSDIQDIVDNLPKELSSSIVNSKQSWGWSCGLDIYLPEGKSITVGGVYGISGHIRQDFVNFIVDNLKQKGYEVYNVERSD